MSNAHHISQRQLRAILATIETGSITKAARKLNLTPPAITWQLKLLEEIVEAPLFDRASPGFVPTEIGQELAAAARDIQLRLDQTVERVAALRAGAAGSVVFAAVSTGKYIAPAMVASFGRHYPHIRIKLVIGNRSEILKGLERNEYDLLLMGRVPQHFSVRSTVLGEHPHVLIAAPDHRLAHDAHVLPEDLMTERFLAREPGSGTRQLMERFLDSIGSGQQFNIIDMGTNETIKQSVIAGLGIAIISAHTCMAEFQDKRLTSLAMPGLPLIRQWFIIHRSDRNLTPAAEAFRDYTMANRNIFFPSSDHLVRLV